MYFGPVQGTCIDRSHDSSSDDDPEQFFESIRGKAEIEEMNERSVKEEDFVLVELAS